MRLTETTIGRLEAGKHRDEAGGNGLYILVQARAGGGYRRSWVQTVTVRGTGISRTLGLGPWPLIPLAEARGTALDNKRMAYRGDDPLRVEDKSPTFAKAVRQVIANRQGAWKAGGKSARAWAASLDCALSPIPVGRVTVKQVEDLLRPLWGTEKARKLHQRLREVFKWAVAHGYRDDNPAEKAVGVLPTIRQQPATHLAALHHSGVGAAIQAVRASDAYLGAKLVLEFLALTAVRSGEARRAAWTEVDMDAATWTVPADRTKTGAELQVPLSAQALAVLRRAWELHDASGLVFPRSRGGGAMTDYRVSIVLRKAGIEGATVHGLRSSFRDWCSEQGLNTEAAEIALGHAVGSKVERAYRRTGLLDERRSIMEAWGQYILG